MWKKSRFKWKKTRRIYIIIKNQNRKRIKIYFYFKDRNREIMENYWWLIINIGLIIRID
jgi:hypothetical protein